MRTLFVKVRFIVKETAEIREQDVFMGDFPPMTQLGHLRHQRHERVVVTQLVRSPGAYIMEPKDPTKQVLTASLMPARGSWLEFEVEAKAMLGAHRPQEEAAGHAFEGAGDGRAEEILSRFEDSWLVRNTLERDDTPPGRKPCLRSSGVSGLASRSTSRTRRTWWTGCSSTPSVTTSLRWGATRSTRSSRYRSIRTP